MAGRVSTYAGFALVLLLTALLAVWGAFLVPFRVGATLVPVSWAVAVAGNLLVGRAGGRLVGRLGAGLTGVLWLGIAFTLGSKRAEGDLVVPGSVTGLVFLLAGGVASAVAYARATPLPASGRTPAGGPS